MPAFSKYIERCQSFLQWGEADNDVMVYLPYYDMIYEQSGTITLFDIHSMDKRAPRFIKTVQTIIQNGYDVDYVSDRYLMKDEVTSRYATIIVPDVRFMPTATLKRLLEIAEKGGQIMFVNSFPQSVPGYGREKAQEEFSALLIRMQQKVSFSPDQATRTKWGKGTIITSPDYNDGFRFSQARKEPMRITEGLSCIRRSNPEGYHYFISNLQGKDVDAYVELGIRAKDIVLYNPMNGQSGLAKRDKKGRLWLQLKSGESIIVRTYTKGLRAAGRHARKYRYYNTESQSTTLTDWTLSFRESAPVRIDKTYTLSGSVKPWTALGDSLLNTTMATGVYRTRFSLPSKESENAYILELGDVRETARVHVNDIEIGMLFSVPFRLDITDHLHTGSNTIEVEVSNLPANRIAQLDRAGVGWRRFKDINVVDLNYKGVLYSSWQTVPSGLNSDVKLIQCLIAK